MYVLTASIRDEHMYICTFCVDEDCTCVDVLSVATSTEAEIRAKGQEESKVNVICVL